ncbi:MAG: zinc-dependent metalloprotease [Bifidobacteriaceae bacterium]|jgi:putative hydrolase|nr:zinc-dependent metalloprotease [Bifidobacteriaceae bacterium]
MSDDSGASWRDLPPELMEVMRALFGEAAEEMIERTAEAGIDPAAMFEAVGLKENPNGVAPLFAHLRRLWQGTPDGEAVNWDLAHDAARETAAAEGPDRAVDPRARAQIAEAVKVAELWLDQATELPASAGTPDALSAAEWVETTLPMWKQLTTPIAKSMRDAMRGLVAEQVAADPTLANLAGGASQMIERVAGGMFGLQLGHALGLLSREVFGYSDTGLPLARRGAVGLLPDAIDRFAGEIDLPRDEVRLFLAAREAAHARLFGRVPWLADRLMAAVEVYAAGIEIDARHLEEAMRELEPVTPEALREALSSGVFTPAPSERQRQALERLETALALVEGWVSVVTERALARNLPDVASLSEMMRRRRAAGGPAEHALATLVGLELRPRRARQAGVLWAAITDDVGPVERERLWSHPDMLPSAADLDEPETFWTRRAERAQAEAALDAEIAAFFDEQE